MIPIIAWNAVFFDDLPETFQAATFWKDIPDYIRYPEHGFRVIIFAMPILMQWGVKDKDQKLGWMVYLLGSLVYFASWSAHIWWPASDWAQSMIGFTAPAFTSGLWLLGIGMIGKRTFYQFKWNRWGYFISAGLFLLFHSWHAFLVYARF